MRVAPGYTFTISSRSVWRFLPPEAVEVLQRENQNASTLDQVRATLSYSSSISLSTAVYSQHWLGIFCAWVSVKLYVIPRSGWFLGIDDSWYTRRVTCWALPRPRVQICLSAVVSCQHLEPARTPAWITSNTTPQNSR